MTCRYTKEHHEKTLQEAKGQELSVPMDRLKELEQKKQQLKELRERRHYGQGDSLVDHLLQTIRQNADDRREATSTMVSVSVQTDAIDDGYDKVATSRSLVVPIDRPEIVTYDKAVQTTRVDTDDELPSQIDAAMSIPNTTISMESEEGKETLEAPVNPPELTPLSLLVIEDQQNSVRIKSFALQEALGDSYPSDRSILNLQSSSKAEHINSWTPDLTLQPETKLKCVSLDYHSDLIVATFQAVPIDRFNILLTPWSHVIVFKWDALQLIDRIDFRGQILTKAIFLRKQVTSNIASILITSHTGKTILYELRCTREDDQSKKMERNLISKNSFSCPIYAISEYTNVPIGCERFLVAGTNSTLNEFSTLDLSIYEDATSGKPPLSNVKVVLPRASDLLVVGENSDEDEDEDQKIGRDSGEQAFADHLLRVSLYDGLAVTALSVSPSNPDRVYVGTEDGGIYHLHLDTIENGKLKVSLDNNGFLPIRSDRDTIEGNSIFHSSHVIALSHNKDGLLMSSSLDWTCRLWDPSQAAQLASIDMGSPIIDSQWLDNENHFCGVLTWDAFCIVKWHYTSVIDSSTLVSKWQASSSPEICYKLSTQEASCATFACFKTFADNNNNHLLALSCDNQDIKLYKLPLLS